MFSGIVQSLGAIRRCESIGGDLRLVVDAGALDPAGIALGDSIAVDGVCLTVAAREDAALCFDLSNETLARTTFGKARAGRRVNLERSLRLSDRLDGHLVSGHVDSVAQVLAIESDARASRWRFSLPQALAPFVAQKGSIAVDGVSLTVNGVDDGSFHVALIPHTLAVTAFQDRRVGDAVNLEVDLLARYVARQLALRGVAA